MKQGMMTADHYNKLKTTRVMRQVLMGMCEMTPVLQALRPECVGAGMLKAEKYFTRSDSESLFTQLLHSVLSNWNPMDHT